MVIGSVISQVSFPWADRRIGSGQPCFIIAEAGVNHNGELSLAHQLVDVAAKAGADAVKFQTFSADRLVTKNAPKAAYQKEHTGAAETQYDMLKKLELDEAAHFELKKHCDDSKILFISTPFDEQSADLLERVGVDAFKMSSGELTNLPFQAYVAGKRKPIIISTGMATMEEVAETVAAVRANGDPPIVLLHCVSAYPAPPEDANLLAMSAMSAAFGVPVGWSDHTLGLEVACASVALGASVLEKHFTLDRTLPGPDHAASLEPHELNDLVCGIRAVQAALGDGHKGPRPVELDVIAVARKSLVAARDLRAGETLGREDVAILRPGTGLPPKYRDSLVGRRLMRDRSAGTLFEPADFQ